MSTTTARPAAPRARYVCPEPNCLACGSEVQGPYCHHCGQRHDDCRRSIIRLVSETLTDAAALDGRFARTCGQILTRPGRHVREYAHGRRSPFTPPVRLFLLVSLLFFTTLQLTSRHLVVLDVELRDREEIAQEAADFARGLSDGFSEEGGGEAPAAEEETRAEVEEALQELEARAEESGRPFVPVPRVSFFEQAPDRTYTDEEKAYLREMIQFENVSINGRDISSDRLAEAIIRVVQNPTAFNQALNEWIPRLMILFVPFLAILGTVVIRGRDAMIYDHLLISIQTHAFAFLIVTFSLWTNWILPPALAGWAFFAGVPLYYLMAIRGAFGRSWRKSIFATLFVFAIYSIFFWGGLLYAAVESLWNLI